MTAPSDCPAMCGDGVPREDTTTFNYPGDVPISRLEWVTKELPP